MNTDYKFKVGDKVKIINCKFGHRFELNTIVTITKCYYEPLCYQATDGITECYIVEDEIEPYTEPKSSNGGTKHDDGKPPMSLIPYICTKEIARVLAHGAKKYEPYNWTKGINYLRVLSGIERHMGSFKDGEDNDPETGISHLAHAACGIIFLLFYQLTGRYKERDDRYKV